MEDIAGQQGFGAPMIFSTSTPSMSSQIRPERAWKASKSSSLALPGIA